MPALPDHATRWRCGACGNLTRFDVTTTRRTKAFHHFTVGGELTVEDEETLGELTRLDCDLAQGYYLARPAPAAALTARLTEREFVTGR